MPNIPITMACGPYDRMEALWSGAVRVEGVDLTYIAIQSPPEIFGRMVKNNAFDVAEMSSAHYLTMRARGDFPFVALPVFPSRLFRLGYIFVNRNAAIREPKDLAGKRIGVQEYRQSAAVWIRGILTEHYGVDLSGVHWLEGGVNVPRRADEVMDLRPLKPVSLELIARDATLSDMLAAGEIDALIGARRPDCFGRHDDVTQLFANPRAEERAFYQRTGIFPIMHTLVIREALYREKPWIAESLYKGLEASKLWAIERMRFSGAMRYMLPWLFDDLDEIDKLFPNGDPFAYGVEANRKPLEALARFLHDQNFIPQPIRVEEFFTPIVGWEE